MHYLVLQVIMVGLFGFMETSTLGRGGSKAFVVLVPCTAKSAHCLSLVHPMDRVILGLFMAFNQLSHHLILY